MAENDTRTQILDVAQEMIQRLGANAMSYQHIGDAVGIRKASIHHHFPTKENLLEALLKRYNTYFLGIVDGIISQEISASKKLAKYADLFEATLCNGKNDKACLCGMLGAELASLGSASAELVRTFYSENQSELARILDEGLESGEFVFRGKSKATAALIFALLEGAVLIARAGGGQRQFKMIRNQLFTLLGRAA